MEKLSLNVSCTSEYYHLQHSLCARSDSTSIAISSQRDQHNNPLIANLKRKYDKQRIDRTSAFVNFNDNDSLFYGIFGMITLSADINIVEIGLCICIALFV